MDWFSSAVGYLWTSSPEKPETRNHASNRWFLADVQPGAAPGAIITGRLNAYNIILNLTWVL